ncbi:hypothetical protein [Sphingomonas carotinifaciens]|uniref:Uncharacterized protein n=1 Tax=Sphingomonas carotinifaciens TaxID=1166323 RepID=A0A1G7FWB2_9SPHN|nr:hypothetical protein [Sphingomonas carotinifaciens]MBB4086264.1 hypothetical protein [Sphingomonas carotinifaciens]MWC42587.1 hypothetical protein [Sphingomonas carotinifaciens]SDE80169.1 hypothetical protein SAMN05216557_101582 [Sphingomonas carotinifaciens]
MVPFQQLLDDAFPPSTDRALMRSVSQAVALASDVMENELFLKSLIGMDIRGHIRRAAVLFSVHEACKSGDLPFESEMTRMPLGGGHWVELRSGQFRAHVCRTDGPVAFPEETPTRQDQRLSNQLELFDRNPVVVPLHGALTQEMYAWLTFGANGSDLTHLCWGMPEAGRNSWLARANVLSRLGPIEVVPVDVPTSGLVLRFRDHIEEALRKNDHESNLNIKS